MTDKDIADFQTTFKRNFGKDLNKDEALEKLLALVGIMRLTYKPMTQEQYSVIEQRRTK